jgi:hypothetical protein
MQKKEKEKEIQKEEVIQDEFLTCKYCGGKAIIEGT